MTAPNPPAPASHSARLPGRLPESLTSLTSDPEQRVIVSIISRLAGWRLADQAHPQVRRWGVPALCAALGVPALLNSADHAGLPVQLAVTLAFVVPLLWREQRPVLVFALTTAVSVVALPFGAFSGADAARAVALYNVGRRGTPRQLVVALGITLAQLVAWAAVYWPGGQLEQATRPEVVTVLAMAAVTAFAGLGLAGRLVNVVIIGLEKERDQQARLAAAQERARVSREMHDILGHTLAVIVGLADGAAALAPQCPERGAETLGIIADSGRDALGELRRLLAVIGDEDTPREGAPLAPQPGLSDLDSLLERFRAAGPTASLYTEGDLNGLGQGLQLAVYRIVQEALTNTLKHAAPDTSVTVTLTAAPDAVSVAVEDTGPSRADGAGGRSSGKGLVGMRERAALYQGAVTCGPNSRGGWTVHARLVPTTPSAPLEGHPA
ncbi:sensor histidine kinase [Streptomyces sp. NPDC020951]|uniref:sensor histidine kinase n=1 Tax=Streptomyces sp. NPDC020951 TaxID=3365104 RepID=UPI003797A346